MSEPVDLLIAHFGSQSAVADEIGVSPMAISHWRRRRVPVERAVNIDRLTGGMVPKERLRPDVFGPGPEAEEQRQAS